jgi:hypothetical protein
MGGVRNTHMTTTHNNLASMRADQSEDLNEGGRVILEPFTETPGRRSRLIWLKA